jgi:hypothetical protein
MKDGPQPSDAPGPATQGPDGGRPDATAPYVVRRTGPERAWDSAPRSPRFVDMVTGAPGLFDTRAAVLWDDEALHVRFWIEEPFVEAHASERDAIVFLENDVEVLIDGGDCYYELEVNALGTIYEVFFIWQDAYGPGSRFDVPEFDLVARHALSFAGDDDRSGPTFWRGGHPRGPRWAFREWDFPGLRSSVTVDGTLNDDSDVDRGWSVEIALPWAGMTHLAGGRSLPPRPGDEWRIFFGRFERLVFGGREVVPHPAWCWTPHGRNDTHRPEWWTRVVFSAEPPGPIGEG